MFYVFGLHPFLFVCFSIWVGVSFYTYLKIVSIKNGEMIRKFSVQNFGGKLAHNILHDFA